MVQLGLPITYVLGLCRLRCLLWKPSPWPQARLFLLLREPLFLAIVFDDCPEVRFMYFELLARRGINRKTTAQKGFQRKKDSQLTSSGMFLVVELSADLPVLKVQKEKQKWGCLLDLQIATAYPTNSET